MSVTLRDVTIEGIGGDRLDVTIEGIGGDRRDVTIEGIGGDRRDVTIQGIGGDRRGSERNVAICGQSESVRYSDQYLYELTFFTGMHSPKVGLPDRRVSPSVQTVPVSGDSCHHANSIMHSLMADDCLYPPRQDFNAVSTMHVLSWTEKLQTSVDDNVPFHTAPNHWLM